MFLLQEQELRLLVSYWPLAPGFPSSRERDPVARGTDEADSVRYFKELDARRASETRRNALKKYTGLENDETVGHRASERGHR